MTIDSDGACGKCHAPLAPQAVLCTNCGTHVKSGLDIGTVQKAKAAGEAASQAGKALLKTGVATLVSCLASVIGGAAWAFLNSAIPSVIHGYVWGFASAIVGGIAGGVFVLFFHERGKHIAFLAMIPALFGMVTGEVLTAKWSTETYARMAVDNNKILRLVYFNKLVRAETGVDIVRVRFESGKIGFEMEEEDWKKIPEDVDTDELLGQAQEKANSNRVDRSTREVAAFLDRNWTLEDRLIFELNALDLLWFGIALGVAWYLGRG